jgi:site-specific DNA-methyltransferase (cytosine-N4-specific)
MIAVGDARQLPLRDGEVSLVLTSPPYFGLRTYTDSPDELGTESSVSEYVENLITVFQNLKVSLAPSANVFVNLGDRGAHTGKQRNFENIETKRKHSEMHSYKPLDFEGVKPNSLLGIPWRFALAMIDQRWTLRQEIIWHKLNPLPDRSTNARAARAHEQVFHFQINPKMAYYDSDTHPGNSVWSTSVASTYGESHDEMHTAVMPLALATKIIDHWSKPGDIVLDPFVGSGTTVLAAEAAKRRGVGFDLSEKWAALATQRVADRKERKAAENAWGNQIRQELFD